MPVAPSQPQPGTPLRGSFSCQGLVLSVAMAPARDEALESGGKGGQPGEVKAGMLDSQALVFCGYARGARLVEADPQALCRAGSSLSQTA